MDNSVVIAGVGGIRQRSGNGENIIKKGEIRCLYPAAYKGSRNFLWIIRIFIIKSLRNGDHMEGYQ